MGNIANWLRDAEQRTGEQIETVVIGRHDCDRYTDDDRRPVEQRDVLLSRDAGLALLDVEYDDGFGGADCFPMYAWCAPWVYFISEYDGSTNLSCVPRNPVDCEPALNGDYLDT